LTTKLRKRAAANEQFGASGGVTRPTLCVGQHSPALVQTAPIPPPAAKLPPRYRQAGQCVFQQTVWRKFIKFAETKAK